MLVFKKRLAQAREMNSEFNATVYPATSYTATRNLLSRNI